MTDWVVEAPRRMPPTVVAAFASGEGESFPAVAMSFEGLPGDKTITVTIVGSEFELRKFQRDLDRAFTKTLRG